MLESLAHHASIAIQNARLMDELKKALENEQGMRNQLVQADKLAALGKLVSVIAHEINNPIQTVKNTFYLLEDQILPGSPAGEYLKIAATEANRPRIKSDHAGECARPAPGSA
jgi:two-component system sensor histidine kinase HydH